MKAAADSSECTLAPRIGGVELARPAGLQRWRDAVGERSLFYAETPSGLLNATGLQRIGIKAFVKDLAPRVARHDTVHLVNVCGDTVEEYAEVARVCDATAPRRKYNPVRFPDPHSVAQRSAATAMCK